MVKIGSNQPLAFRLLFAIIAFDFGSPHGIHHSWPYVRQATLYNFLLTSSHAVLYLKASTNRGLVCNKWIWMVSQIPVIHHDSEIHVISVSGWNSRHYATKFKHYNLVAILVWLTYQMLQGVNCSCGIFLFCLEAVVLLSRPSSEKEPPRLYQSCLKRRKTTRRKQACTKIFIGNDLSQLYKQGAYKVLKDKKSVTCQLANTSWWKILLRAMCQIPSNMLDHWFSSCFLEFLENCWKLPNETPWSFLAHDCCSSFVMHSNSWTI